MKKTLICLLLALYIIPLVGCSSASNQVQIACTTLPVYEFTSRICDNTDISVGRLVNEEVSCLHDYTLQVSQMRMAESADAVIISGAGLESFLDDVLDESKVLIDASSNTHVHAGGQEHHHDDHGHEHEVDPHIWLSPENAKIMVENICNGLCQLYPSHTSDFENNADALLRELDQLQLYGSDTLSQLSCRELVTFHDGFAYFAESFDLTILKAVEEESGSEASALELIELITLVGEHQIPAVFTERNGSTSAAEIICKETGTEVFMLDMAMSGNSYFDAMYNNIDAVKEALE